MFNTVQILDTITSSKDFIQNQEFFVTEESFDRHYDFHSLMEDVIHSLDGAKLVQTHQAYYFIFSYNAKFFIILINYDKWANGFNIKLSSHSDIDDLKDIADVDENFEDDDY